VVAAKPHESDEHLVALLRAGDESAFAQLVEVHHATMLRLAMGYVHDQQVAEEVVQEAWLGVLRGLDRFEERSSLKTWIFHILANTAKTQAVRERRSMPLSALPDPPAESFEPAVEPERFLPLDAPRWPGHWVSFPQGWGDAPEERLISWETKSQIRAAIDALPPSQREVVSLRDVHGCSAEEVCSALRISEANQRVLLHRGRSRVRRALELYLTGK
jgi:RNA polymerase sigma-70 factor (ECF subfamily)